MELEHWIHETGLIPTPELDQERYSRANDADWPLPVFVASRPQDVSCSICCMPSYDGASDTIGVIHFGVSLKY